jgi:hypothetical protein
MSQLRGDNAIDSFLSNVFLKRHAAREWQLFTG